ncbi:hypothetical protein GCM10009841_17180 [Microlunatus panaciterrae]
MCPARAIRSAMARPIPLLPPVTSTLRLTAVLEVVSPVSVAPVSVTGPRYRLCRVPGEQA